MTALWWQTRTWRLIQTNLREIDMLDISAEQVVADLQRFQANVLMINAAGIIASYPTQLPFHYQSSYLKAGKHTTTWKAKNCYNRSITRKSTIPLLTRTKSRLTSVSCWNYG